ncbi:MAG: 23S rRNA (adenine(2503)-C(2))-methyltransferase RlmN [Porphyromonadaceae bacterium]|nr:23S rRNA (adenine(2503)-C(2))-methyltransferase RlmN [Porphyromonadaceae bacterium]
MSLKQSLAGKTLEQLQAITTQYDMPRFTASQIAIWLYRNRVSSIDEMTNLSKVNRQRLSADFEVGYLPPVGSHQAADGTVKYLFAAGDNFVETVYIPDRERATLCVSSQVGCKMNCRFCMTGKQGFNGNLTATEIINQIVSVPEFERLTNLVFMGMGEPLDNIDEVLKAIDILTSKEGFAWSPHRITLSTIGVIPALHRFLDRCQCHLAVSLHSPFPEERQRLIPAQKAYPISGTVELLRNYDFSHQRRLSFEYIVFEGINDTTDHVNKVAQLLHGLDCRINLIRFHAIPQVNLHSPSEEKMTALRDAFSRKGFICTIRASRGEEIQAACGMLSTARKQQG